MLLEYALIEKNFDQCQIEMNFPFIFCTVMYYIPVLMFNLINSYPRTHRNSFSVKIRRGKSLWKDSNNGYDKCKGSEGSATCKTHRLTHKNSNVTESWWEKFLRTY